MPLQSLKKSKVKVLSKNILESPTRRRSILIYSDFFRNARDLCNSHSQGATKTKIAVIYAEDFLFTRRVGKTGNFSWLAWISKNTNSNATHVCSMHNICGKVVGLAKASPI